MTDTDTEENWVPIAGKAHYEISDKGRVRSLPRRVPCGFGRYRTVPGGLLTPSYVRGHLVINIRRRGEANGVTERLAAMVLTAFVGPRPGSHYCPHFRDGNPMHVAVRNVYWAPMTELKHHKEARNG